MIVSLENVPKNLENVQEKMENWKCEYPLNHSTNFSAVVHSNFQWMCLVIDRIYDDRIPRKCSQKLRKFAGNGKPENANIY